MSEVAVSGKQTRRRGRALEQAILDAAWAELAERGWARFTIEGVAARAGAAKSVIYRRWQGRVDLAQAMLQRSTSASPQEFRSSGDLRTDLLDFMRGTARFMNGPFGDAVRGVVHEGDPTTQASLFSDDAVISFVADIVRQARGRGELAGNPSALALNLGHAVLMSEFLHTHRPPADDSLIELVDTVWLPAIRASASGASFTH